MSTLIQDRDFPGVSTAISRGIDRGRVLRDWWNTSPRVEMLELAGSRPDSRMRCFFSEARIDGAITPLSGCFQTSTFAHRAASGAPAVGLAEWVGANFLRSASWADAKGRPTGFRYRPAVVSDLGKDFEPHRVDENLPLRLDEIGAKYEWAVVRLDLHDYMKAIPGMENIYHLMDALNREAGYMVIHSDFFGTPHPAPDGCVEEYTFAYSVSPWTVMPTPAAYGPGRFHSAFKQFRFFLMDDGSVSVEVLFLVAPQCRKMMNFLGFDPVFHTVGAIDALTFRAGKLVRACPKIRKIGPTSGPGPGGRPENVEGDDFRASIGGIQGRSKAA